MWDGSGWPGELEGDAIPVASRIAQLAEFVEVAHRTGGIEAATSLARARASRQFDPRLAARLCADPDAIFDGLDELRTWEAVIAGEPALAVVLSGERFDAALEAIANFIDLKSPFTLGHAGAVADLAAEAATLLGLGDRRDPHRPPRGARARLRAPRRVERDLGQGAVRWASASGNGCACIRI